MEIILPKKYLSYSQYDLWKRSKKQYREKYYIGGVSFENKETIFGKQFAKMMEDGVVNEITKKVPKYPKMEHRIMQNVLGVPFLGYLDSFDEDTCSILEYKTGKDPWNNVRVAKHDQLVIYSMLTRLKYGKVDPYVRLVWIETKYGVKEHEFDGHILEGKKESLEFTGRVDVFKRKIVQWERDKMAEKIRKVAEEITKDYEIYRNTIVNTSA